MSRIQRRDFLRFCIVVLVAIPMFAMLNTGGLDFDSQYYRAAQGWPRIYKAVPVVAVPQGGIFGVFFPWAVVIIQPLSLLPLIWARAVVQSISLATFIAVAGPSSLSRLMAFLNPLVLLLLFHQVNLDAVALLGVWLPPVGGLFLLAMKPQIAGGVALLWLFRGHWKSFIPLAVVVLLSTIVWPVWIVRFWQAPEGALNVALFPWSLLVAFPLMVLAIRRNARWVAVATTPLLVPYIAIYSLAPLCVLLCRYHWRWGLLLNMVAWSLVIWFYHFV